MKKYMLILSVMLISLLAVGAVSASDNNITNDVFSSVKDSNIDNQIAVEEINDLENKSLTTEIGSIVEENISDDINNQSTENGVNGIDTTVNVIEDTNPSKIKSVPTKVNVDNVLGAEQGIVVLSDENGAFNFNFTEFFNNFNFDMWNLNGTGFNFTGLNLTGIFDNFNITDFLNKLNFTELFKNWNITGFLDNFNFTNTLSGLNITD